MSSSNTLSKSSPYGRFKIWFDLGGSMCQNQTPMVENIHYLLIMRLHCFFPYSLWYSFFPHASLHYNVDLLLMLNSELQPSLSSVKMICTCYIIPHKSFSGACPFGIIGSLLWNLLSAPWSSRILHLSTLTERNISLIWYHLIKD
jgi:hypothetical protein